MTTMGATTFSALARGTAEFISDFASVIHNLIMDVRDSYRPGLHYMRGRGPKWRRQHQISPAHARRCDAAHFTR